MKRETKNSKNKEKEKGAAIVMVLLISLLLLTASAGLLLESSMNTANVTDATTEIQAYNAAESGIQSAINVLRGNVTPSPLIDPSKSPDHVSNRINFKKAITLATSNQSTDNSGFPRLSRWMNYNYTPGGSSIADRVALCSQANMPCSGTYTPLTGFAYSVTLTDPDNTGAFISFNTSGRFYNPVTKQWNSSITFGSSGNTAIISFTGTTVSKLDVSSGAANTNFGSFNNTVAGEGASVPDNVRFEIVINMTKPFVGKKVIRGSIKTGSIISSSGAVLEFDSSVYDFAGSIITLQGLDSSKRITLSTSGSTSVGASITQVEPRRLVIKSTGYGPRGAKKQLEATIRKNYFDGLSAPATLTMIGSSNGFAFEEGNSKNVTYSGDDVVTNAIIPPIGTTNDANWEAVMADINARPDKGNIVGTPANVNIELPPWLESTYNLDDTIEALRDVAEASGRYYPSGTTPPNFGDNFNATGITFADGDVSLSGNGGGILVCTGTLTLNGGFDFNGLIIVTGSGGVNRSGGGGGTLQGNIVIAPYNKNDKAAGFGGPKYDISGGGNSTIRYNSSSVANGMTAISNLVVGVAEK